MNYQLTEFKTWLAEQANHPNLPNWETIYQQLGDEFTEESLANLTAYPQQQALLQEWISSLETPSRMIGAFPTNEPAKLPKKILKKAASTSDLNKIKEEPKTKSLEKQVKVLTILANQRKEALEQEKNALIILAKQKLKSKKEAKDLVTNLTSKWAAEKQSLIQKHQGEIDQKQTALVILRHRIDTLKHQLEERDTETTNLQQKLTKTTNLNEEILTNYQILEHDNSELKKALNNLKFEHDDLTWIELQQELKQNKETITALQGQQHYWVYTLVAIVLAYLVVR